MRQYAEQSTIFDESMRVLFYCPPSTAIASSFSNYVSLYPIAPYPFNDLQWGTILSGSYNEIAVGSSIIGTPSEFLGNLFGQPKYPSFHSLPYSQIKAAQDYLMSSAKRVFYWWEQDSFNLFYNNCRTYANNQFAYIVSNFG